MTIEQAWLIVLEHYHDALPAELQWRPGQKCPGSNYYRCRHGHTRAHDIPAPALTDAAALAVLRVLNERTNWDTISKAIDATGVDYEGDIRDAIILAAAEMAQKERAK